MYIFIYIDFIIKTFINSKKTLVKSRLLRCNFEKSGSEFRCIFH